MKRILSIFIIIFFSFSSISFAKEFNFSNIENSSNPSIMDFNYKYEEETNDDNVFYVLDFYEGYTLPNLIKDESVNKLKTDIENKSLSDISEINKSNYPELFDEFDVKTLNCKSGDKFVVISEKEIITTQENQGSILPILFVVILATIIIFIIIKMKSSKKRTEKDNLEDLKLQKVKTLSSNNDEDEIVKKYNELKEENEILKHSLENEIQKSKQKEKDLEKDFLNRKKNLLEKKENLEKKKMSEISKEAEKRINERLKNLEKDFNNMVSQYKIDINAVNDEKEILKLKAAELEKKESDLLNLQNEKEAEIQEKELALLAQQREFNKLKDREILDRYLDKIPDKIYSQLENAEDLFSRTGNKEDCASEALAYTRLVELLLEEATPSDLKNKYKIHGLRDRLNRLKINTSITKAERRAYTMFFEDANEKGFFDIRNGAAHSGQINKNQLAKLRYFLFYDDVKYYNNVKECRFNWLLKMAYINNEKEKFLSK